MNSREIAHKIWNPSKVAVLNSVSLCDNIGMALVNYHPKDKLAKVFCEVFDEDNVLCVINEFAKNAICYSETRSPDDSGAVPIFEAKGENICIKEMCPKRFQTVVKVLMKGIRMYGRRYDYRKNSPISAVGIYRRTGTGNSGYRTGDTYVLLRSDRNPDRKFTIDITGRLSGL
jgi:hypothetical protein